MFRIFGVILLGFWQFGGLWALAGLGFVWVLRDWGPGTCRQEQLVRLKHVSLLWKPARNNRGVEWIPGSLRVCHATSSSKVLWQRLVAQEVSTPSKQILARTPSRIDGASV